MTKKEVLLGDCLELMKDIPNGSIDAIITDPPYGTTECKWDSVIDFSLMWEQLKRIIKPNGAIVLFGSEPFSSFLRISNIKCYRYDIKWVKTRPTGFHLAKTRPLNSYEDVIVFSLAKTGHNTKLKMKYNPQKTTGHKEIKPKNNKNVTSDYLPNRKPRTDKSAKDYNGTERYPKNNICFKNNETGLHPTQKPVALMEYLIKTYTNENETVLDFTAGSGTTAIACLNTKRQFIVMEKEQKYYDIILKRIEDFNNNLTLF
jgi:DNA modification methylase